MLKPLTVSRKLLDDLKYYLDIDGVMVFPEKTNQNNAVLKFMAQ